MKREAENLQWRILKVLEEISGKLDRLISLNELALAGQAASVKEQILARSELRREVYELCNGKRTVSDIAKTLAKSVASVSQILSKLEDARLVKVRKSGKKRYYEKVV
jgi:DNA-binding transcriptional ArsR family regulator